MGQGAAFSNVETPIWRGAGLARAVAGRWFPGGRARITGAGSVPHASGVWTGELPLARMEDAAADWARLAADALEPNAFLAPGFLLAAARHFPPGERPRFIVARDAGGALAGVFPMAPARLSGAQGLAPLWRGELSALATPLVGRARPAETVAAFLDWLGAESPAAGVLFPRLVAGGPFEAALRAAAARGRRGLTLIESHARAALLPGASADEKCAQAGGRKKLNEINRVQRRLAAMGAVRLDVAAAPGELRAATEEFLALEAAGWKAGRGAFLSEPALATFLRSATRQLAGEGLCRIAALRLDGRAIAMAILLESQNRSYCWKIAFDERLRAQAPGVQLIHALTGAQLGRPDIELTDSCAIADHPMINRLWPDRLVICDIAVSLRGAGPGDAFDAAPDASFDAACRRETGRRRLREFAKRTACRLLNRKVS